MSIQRLRTLLAGTLSALIAELLASSKISFIMGSHTAFFRAIECYNPAVAITQGVRVGWLGTLLRTLYYGIRTGSIQSYILAYHIPTFLGIAYGATLKPDASLYQKIASTLLCLSCILLFIAHPVGQHAPFYTLFWLFPALAPFLIKSTFMRLLATTLATHGVGSVLWLYTVPTTPALWHNLFLITGLERLSFATGGALLVLSYQLMTSYSTPFFRLFRHLLLNSYYRTVLITRTIILRSSGSITYS